ncbi:Lrr-containing protein, partial [Globisporangium splendens]
MLDFDAVVGGKEPAFDDDADVDLARLAAKDRDAIMARVTPDDSAPPDAFALAQNEIRREMIDRGIQPKGFYNDDAARLQEEFNREHVAEKEARMQQRIQFAELREEVSEVAKNPQLEVWLGLVKDNETPKQANLRLNAIGTRALCKSLVFNHSLNLSRNHLDDVAGKCIAQMLRRNTTLSRLELESNGFGPQSATDFADALRVNEALQYLNLESNPLTDNEKDFSVGLEKNSTLLCVDIGNNRIATSDGLKTDQRVSKNRHAFAQREAQKIGFREAQLKAAEKERARQADLQKQAEYDQWVEERKLERQQDREAKEAERQRQLKLEEDRLRQLAARKAAEFAARAELDKKKKKKKKGGAKKKKE